MTNRMAITRKQKWEEKTLYGRFKRFAREKLDVAKEVNRKRETSLLIAAQNNVIRPNHIKARIDKTQNSKCRLCGDRDETTNHIRSKCSRLAQKEYKTRDDWVGKVIHWNLNLTIRTNDKCTTQQLSWRITHTNSYGIALLRTNRILRKVLETWEDLVSLKLQWKPIS